jgi:outer membrane protein OmpA-like peptidoglycan-associated protein
MKMIRKVLLAVFFISVFNTFSQLDLSYNAIKLDSAINSEYSECAPVFSPDGSTLYFIRVNHPENRYGANGSQDIWKSELVNGKWQLATRLPNTVNLSRYNAIYGVWPSGELIINGIYDHKGVFYKRGISKVTVNSDSTYGAPIPIRFKGYSNKSDGGVASMCFDANAQKMFVSFSKHNNSKKNDIYVSLLKKNKWTKPKKLKGLNSAKSDETPFLSYDGSTMYFSSNGGHSKRNYEIYSSIISDVNEFRRWSEPTQVGGDFSSQLFDGFFILDPKEEYAYFTSNRDGESNSEIYKLQVKDVRNFVLVKGFVFTINNGEKLKPKTNFSINVHSQGTIGKAKKIELLNYKVSTDSSYFEFEIPFGTNYVMTANVDGYEESPVNLELNAISGYQEVFKDARVKAVPILTLTGRLEYSDKNKSDFSEVKIYANNKVLESAVINKDGSYSLTLTTGAKYSVEARRKNHISFPVEVDVTNEKSKVAKTALLKLEEIPETFSVLKVRVTNKKDMTSIDSSKYKVFLNGKLASNEMLNYSSEGFELKLDKGKKYFVMVKSHDYIEAHDSIDFRNVKSKEIVNTTYLLTPIEVGATVKIKNIYFDLGKSTLKIESYPELDRLVELLTEHDHLKIEVSGHTDSKGNAYLNQKLSTERALSVKEYLINTGKIDASRLESKGYGFSKPLAENDTESNRALNRRVEFMILSND